MVGYPLCPPYNLLKEKKRKNNGNQGKSLHTHSLGRADHSIQLLILVSVYPQRGGPWYLPNSRVAEQLQEGRGRSAIPEEKAD